MPGRVPPAPERQAGQRRLGRCVAAAGLREPLSWPSGSGPAERGQKPTTLLSFHSLPSQAGAPCPLTLTMDACLGLEVSKVGEKEPFLSASHWTPFLSGQLNLGVPGLWTPGQQAWALGCDFCPLVLGLRGTLAPAGDRDVLRSGFSCGFGSGFWAQRKQLTSQRDGGPRIKNEGSVGRLMR